MFTDPYDGARHPDVGEPGDVVDDDQADYYDRALEAAPDVIFGGGDILGDLTDAIAARRADITAGRL